MSRVFLIGVGHSEGGGGQGGRHPGKSLSKAAQLSWPRAVKKCSFRVAPRWPKAWPIPFPLESVTEFGCI